MNRRIIRARVWEPIVLRAGVPGRFEELLLGRSFSGMHRHGPFLVFSLAQFEIIVHFMLAGRFRLESSSLGKLRRLAKEHCWSLALDSGAALHYLDSRRMGKIYLIRAGETAEVPGFENQGAEALLEDFTLEVFKKALAGRRQQVRVFLMGQPGNIDTRMGADAVCDRSLGCHCIARPQPAGDHRGCSHSDHRADSDCEHLDGEDDSQTGFFVIRFHWDWDLGLKSFSERVIVGAAMKKGDCKGDHQGHLCVLASNDQIEKIKELTRNPRYICFNCGRVADSETNLCNPMSLND